MNFNIDRLVFFSNHPDVLNGFTHFFKPDYFLELRSISILLTNTAPI